jgi:hypothetical protein
MTVPIKEVTVYSDGFSSILRSGNETVPLGDVELFLQNFTQSAIASSISVWDNGGSIREIGLYSREHVETKNVSKLLSFGELLNKSIGKEISLTINGKETNATLLWYDEGRIGISDGSGIKVLLMENAGEISLQVSEYNKTEKEDTPVYEKGLRIREDSQADKHSLDMNYLVSGASWDPNYKYYITEDKNKGVGSLQGWAEVTNGAGEDWENITLNVVVGYPHIVSYVYYPYLSYTNVGYGGAMEKAAAPSIAPSVEVAPVSEYIVYKITLPISLKSGEVSNYPLFDRQTPFTREYVWDTYWQMPRKIYKLNNTGGESWAAGTARVYLDGEFIGEDRIEYTPKGKEAEVYVSDVPDVVVKKETINSTTKEDSGVRITTTVIKLTIENKKTENMELTVKDRMDWGDEVTLVKSDPPATVKPDNMLEWKMSVEKGKTAEINYEYVIKNYPYKNYPTYPMEGQGTTTNEPTTTG